MKRNFKLLIIFSLVLFMPALASQPPNETNPTEEHVKEQQKLIDEEKDEKGVSTELPIDIDKSASDYLNQNDKDQDELPNAPDSSFVKDPEKEYKRSQIQKEKDMNFDEIIKMLEHPDIRPSTPEKAGFDPDDDRYFYEFNTKKGNTYYLIIDDVGRDKKILVATPTTESDLLSLLTDTDDADDIIAEKEEELENTRKLKEEIRRQEAERKRKQKEALNKSDETEVNEKEASKISLPIQIGAFVLAGIFIVFIIKKIKGRR